MSSTPPPPPPRPSAPPPPPPPPFGVIGRPPKPPLPGWRIALGVIFAVLVFPAMLVGFVFIASEGETGPAGLDRDEQGRLVVFVALCEGETVERIEVTTSVEDSLLWTVEGEGSAQERWVVGEPLPPGYQVVAKSPDLSGTQGYVYADVKTSELYAWNSASQEALALPGVTFDDAQVPAEQFHAKARSSYPCHDPYNDRLSAIGGAIGYGLAVVFLGLSLVMFLWRRRPKPEAV